MIKRLSLHHFTVWANVRIVGCDCDIPKYVLISTNQTHVHQCAHLTGTIMSGTSFLVVRNKKCEAIWTKYRHVAGTVLSNSCYKQ